MNTFKIFLIGTLFIFSSTISYSQEQTQDKTQKLSLEKGTVENQIEYVIKRSNNYQEYKVVKKTWLNTLKLHVTDSIKSLKNEINESKDLINSQKDSIDSLNSLLTNTNKDLATVNEEKDQIQLLGIQTSKPFYNTVLWSIIAGLLGFLLFFIFKYKNSIALTKHAENSLKETEEEFEEHRKKALEREQKVRRQLQDELNKQKKE